MLLALRHPQPQAGTASVPASGSGCHPPCLHLDALPSRPASIRKRLLGRAESPCPAGIPPDTAPLAGQADCACLAQGCQRRSTGAATGLATASARLPQVLLAPSCRLAETAPAPSCGALCPFALHCHLVRKAIQFSLFSKQGTLPPWGMRAPAIPAFRLAPKPRPPQRIRPT